MRRGGRVRSQEQQLRAEGIICHVRLRGSVSPAGGYFDWEEVSVGPTVFGPARIVSRNVARRKYNGGGRQRDGNRRERQRICTPDGGGHGHSSATRRERPPKPNLICASSKNVTVERSVGDTWVENIDGALPAVVAVISNRATEGDVAIAREVKAQMIFYNDEGGECFHGTGAWLGLFRNVADFSPGASQKLLLALDNDPHSIAAISNTNERPLPRSARAQIRALESSRQTVEVLALPVLCDVTLLATSGAVLGNFAMQICRKGNALSCTPTEALE